MAFSRTAAAVAESVVTRLGRISVAVEHGLNRINQNPTLSGAAGSVLAATTLAAGAYAYEKAFPSVPEPSANEAALKAENKLVHDLLQKQHEAHMAELAALTEATKATHESHERAMTSLQARVETLEASSSTPWYSSLLGAKQAPARDAEKGHKGPELQ